MDTMRYTFNIAILDTMRCIMPSLLVLGLFLEGLFFETNLKHNVKKYKKFTFVRIALA